MTTNLEQYRKDFEKLEYQGIMLLKAIQYECYPKETEKEFKKISNKDINEIIKELPSFKVEYQKWYSEALVLIKQLLPDRLSDFLRYYEKQKTRKEVNYENYTIEDYLLDLVVTRGIEKKVIVGTDSAIPKFRQQFAIFSSIKNRFESSLFDIRQLVQADLFDSELDEAKELAKNKFIRAAGALAGVVLEHHLSQVCKNHNLKVLKKDPGISDLNDILKKAEVIEIPQWRNIQYLADIRNLCDHDKKIEPTSDQVDELINGTIKTIKNVF